MGRFTRGLSRHIYWRDMSVEVAQAREGVAEEVAYARAPRKARKRRLKELEVCEEAAEDDD